MDKQFSAKFNEYIGDENVVSRELFDAILSTEIVRANIEILFSLSCRLMDVCKIEELRFVQDAYPSFFDLKSSSVGHYYNFPMVGDPRMDRFNWEIVKIGGSRVLENITKKQGKGIVDLYSTICGISELDATNALANINHLMFNEMIDFNNNGFGISEEFDENLSLDYLPKVVECCDGSFVFQEFFYIRTSKSVLGAFIVYKTQAGKEMLLPSFVNYNSLKYPAPCTVSGNSVPGVSHKQRNDLDSTQKSFLSLGQRGKSFLLNMGKISSLSNDGVVLLCETPLVAIKIQKFIDLCDQVIRERYLATTWYGGEFSLDGADFSYLYNKNVIFLPAINAESYFHVFKCKKNVIRSP